MTLSKMRRAPESSSFFFYLHSHYFISEALSMRFCSERNCDEIEFFHFLSSLSLCHQHEISIAQKETVTTSSNARSMRRDSRIDFLFFYRHPRHFISGDNMEEAGAKENLYLPSCYSAHYPRIIGGLSSPNLISRVLGGGPV